MNDLSEFVGQKYPRGHNLHVPLSSTYSPFAHAVHVLFVCKFDVFKVTFPNLNGHE